MKGSTLKLQEVEPNVTKSRGCNPSLVIFPLSAGGRAFCDLYDIKEHYPKEYFRVEFIKDGPQTQSYDTEYNEIPTWEEPREIRFRREYLASGESFKSKEQRVKKTGPLINHAHSIPVWLVKKQRQTEIQSLLADPCVNQDSVCESTLIILV